MTQEIMEEIFQKHHANCDEYGHHPDGCFYCGGDHPSGCCLEPDSDEFDYPVVIQILDCYLEFDPNKIIQSLLEQLEDLEDLDIDPIIPVVDEMYSDY